MNIFMVTSVPLNPPWDQGDKNLAYTLATALPQHRFRVLTASTAQPPMGANLLLQPVYHGRHPTLTEKVRVYWHLLHRPEPLALVYNPLPGAAADADLREVCVPAIGGDPDLYHLVYQPYALSSRLCRVLPEFRRRPTLHTVPATANGRPLTSGLFFADRVVALSAYGCRLLQRLGVRNVIHIPPGIDTGTWIPLAQREDEFKARLGLTGHPVVLFPGHWGEGQGADVMLRALPAIAAAHPDVRVLFACRLRSSTDEARELAAREELAAQGLLDNALFFHTVPNILDLIGASDLVALPLETMRDKVDIPTTLLEFMAAGKPIVISDLAPMSELVLGGGQAAGDDVGVAVPVGDDEALATAVIELLRDAGARRQMGQAGQDLVSEQYDIHRVAESYDALYRQMV